MGNEMGNNNTSALREEDASFEDKEKTPNQSQDQEIDAAEGRDENLRQTGLVSGDPGSLADGHTTGGREQLENGFHPRNVTPDAKPQLEKTEGENRDKQPSAGFEDSENDRDRSSSSSEDLSAKIEHQLETPATPRKEEEEKTDCVLKSVSESNDLEPQETVNLKSDQHDLSETETFLPEHVGVGVILPQASEENGHTSSSSSTCENFLSNSDTPEEEIDELREEKILAGQKLNHEEEDATGESLGKEATEIQDLPVVSDLNPNVEPPTVIDQTGNESAEASLVNGSQDLQLEGSEADHTSTVLSKEAMLVEMERENGEEKISKDAPVNNVNTDDEQLQVISKKLGYEDTTALENGKTQKHSEQNLAHEASKAVENGKPEVVAGFRIEEPIRKESNVAEVKKKQECEGSGEMRPERMFRSRSLPVKQAKRMITLQDEDSSNKGSISELKQPKAYQELQLAVASSASKTGLTEEAGDVHFTHCIGEDERFSTESNPDATDTHSPLRKSPSFGPDLRIGAKTEESSNPAEHTELINAMPAEEKIVMQERSDTEKSGTPFLGFMKKDEEDHSAITSHIQELKEKEESAENFLHDKKASSDSSKGKEKRRNGASLFSTCLCCTTVIN